MEPGHSSSPTDTCTALVLATQNKQPAQKVLDIPEWLAPEKSHLKESMWNQDQNLSVKSEEMLKNKMKM